MIDFDGPNLTITLAQGVTEVDAAEIYSRWKEWVILSDNAKFFEAFRVIGGDPLGGGLRAGSYFFLQNQYGWRIKPFEEDIIITITGNIFAELPTSPIFIPTVGDFNTSIRLQTSSLTQVVEVNSGSGVTEQDKADIAALVWDQLLANHTGANTFGGETQFIRKLLANRVTISPDDSETTIFDDDKVSPILVFDHADVRNRDPR